MQSEASRRHCIYTLGAQGKAQLGEGNWEWARLSRKGVEGVQPLAPAAGGGGGAGVITKELLWREVENRNVRFP